jgi:hypothetical protein
MSVGLFPSDAGPLRADAHPLNKAAARTREMIAERTMSLHADHQAAKNRRALPSLRDGGG